MADYVADEIAQARATVQSAYCGVEGAYRATRLSMARWVGERGTAMAKRAVVVDNPELAQQLGADAIRQVKDAAAELESAALSEIDARLPESKWPHSQLSEALLRARSTSGEPSRSARLLGTFGEEVRTLLGAYVGRALVAAGFHKAVNPHDRSNSGIERWYRTGDGGLRYPFALDPDNDLAHQIERYNAALMRYLAASREHLQVRQRSAQLSAEGLWDAA